MRAIYYCDEKAAKKTTKISILFPVLLIRVFFCEKSQRGAKNRNTIQVHIILIRDPKLITVVVVEPSLGIETILLIGQKL